MLEFIKIWLELKTDRRAVTALEYGLMASLIAVALILAVGKLTTGLSTVFTTIGNDL